MGPVGQFDLWAERCNRERVSLRDLILINMDEYLEADGRAFIQSTTRSAFAATCAITSTASSTRTSPRLLEHRLFPDPADIDGIGRAIERFGGVDVCFGGVGIMGHLAFNDPPEFPDPTDARSFARLPTRIVRLSRETLLINSVTAAHGNIDRIPRRATTVGMREILESRQIRLLHESRLAKRDRAQGAPRSGDRGRARVARPAASGCGAHDDRAGHGAGERRGGGPLPSTSSRRRR